MRLGLLLPRLEAGAAGAPRRRGVARRSRRGRFLPRPRSPRSGRSWQPRGCRRAASAARFSRARLDGRGSRGAGRRGARAARSCSRRASSAALAAARRCAPPCVRASLLVELELARAQASSRAAGAPLGIVDARRDDEAVAALARSRRVARLDRGALFGDAVRARRRRCGRVAALRASATRPATTRRRQRRRGAGFMSGEVSTLRRASGQEFRRAASRAAARPCAGTRAPAALRYTTPRAGPRPT